MPAVTIGPDVEVPERGQGERLISAGGNIYTLSVMAPKTGIATRGRGFWTGIERDDPDNPDVDNPTPYGVQTLIERDHDNDGFDDDVDPLLALYDKGSLSHITKPQMKAAKQMVEAAYGSPMSKAILTLGNIKVDLLLQDPEELTAEQLVKSSKVLKGLITRAESGVERKALAGYASRLSKAMQDLLKAKDILNKAVPKSEAQKEGDEQKKKKAKMPPKKAQTAVADDKGKTQYKYPKKGNGKGPNSDGVRPEPGEVSNGGEGPQVTPPPQIDHTAFAKVLGVPPEQLERFAKKKTRQEFANVFLKNKELVKKHGIMPEFLNRLHDSLVTPDIEQQPQEEQAPPPPPMGGQAGKSLVVFNGATLNNGTRALVDMLQAHQAQTVDDIRKCLQTHYACSAERSLQITRTLLNKWERQGLLTFYSRR